MMDKKEATDYILKSVNEGKTRLEIVDFLGKSLNAPSNIIDGFYDRVIGLAEEEPDNRPIEKIGKLVLHKPEPDESIQMHISSVGKNYQQEIEKFIDVDAIIMQALNHHRLVNDIIIDICQKTGWNWEQAQKYVADFQSKNYAELTNKPGGSLLFISILFVIGGLTLTFISLSEMVNIFIPNIRFFLPILSLPVTAFPYILAGLVTGIGLSSFGIYGIWNSIANPE